MKVTIDIDCTPEEARAFMGLPDVKQMQEAMMKEVEERMRANLQSMDPETIFKNWLPAGVQSFEQMQKMFWSQMTGGEKDKKDKKDD